MRFGGFNQQMMPAHSGRRPGADGAAAGPAGGGVAEDDISPGSSSPHLTRRHRSSQGSKRTWNHKVFVPPSAQAPRDLFLRDGIFHAPHASRVCSHALTEPELRMLSKTLGYMPRVVQLNADTTTRKRIQERVAELDDALRKHVQDICDRFHSSNVTQYRTRLGQWCVWMGRMFHLGVIREVLPQVVFFLTFTIGLQFYAHRYNWDFKWTAVSQDTVYYPALTLSFLLSFRASACMARYSTGCECIFKMEKHLREMAFDVVAGLSLDQAQKGAAVDEEEQALKQKYFKHEFRRLIQVVFVCAVRDLNDSAQGEDDTEDEVASRMRFSLTDVEHAAVHVTHSNAGHVLRVYMVAAWLQELVNGAQEAGLFDDRHVADKAAKHLCYFKDAWIKARDVAYSGMPDSIIDLVWLLTCAINFVLPWEYVTVCRWWTWLPSLFASTSFFGIIQIAKNLENPFGVDEDDIPVWEVAAHLDEEVALILFYSALDEVGGENLYRGLSAQDHINVAF